jgi:hypothetical protein
MAEGAGKGMARSVARRRGPWTRVVEGHRQHAVYGGAVAADQLGARLRADHQRRGLVDCAPRIVLGLDLEDLGRLVAVDTCDLALAGRRGRGPW